MATKASWPGCRGVTTAQTAQKKNALCDKALFDFQDRFSVSVSVLAFAPGRRPAQRRAHSQPSSSCRWRAVPCTTQDHAEPCSTCLCRWIGADTHAFYQRAARCLQRTFSLAIKSSSWPSGFNSLRPSTGAVVGPLIGCAPRCVRPLARCVPAAATWQALPCRTRARLAPCWPFHVRPCERRQRLSRLHVAQGLSPWSR